MSTATKCAFCNRDKEFEAASAAIKPPPVESLHAEADTSHGVVDTVEAAGGDNFNPEELL